MATQQMFGKKYQLKRLFDVFFIFLFFLTSCSSPTPQIIEITRIVPQTVVVTQLVEVIITATPIPASSTPTPTTPPTMTPTPAFIIWNTQQVVDVFLAAGLEATDVRPMVADDYGIAPLLAIEGTRFFIPSLCGDCGGRIMSFASQTDRDALQKYYKKLAESSALFFTWVFVKDNILVQINGDLPEADARLYEAALYGMK
jgi:hypothetical protein